MKTEITINISKLTNITQRVTSFVSVNSKKLKDKTKGVTKSIRQNAIALKHAFKYEVEVQKIIRANAENEIKLVIINKVQAGDELTEHEQFLFDQLKQLTQ
jgi:5-formyltetrahydrofolate cyclo-ligase